MFSGLLIGAMLPYWFSSMTMKSVGKAALAMVEEVRHQFNTIAGLMEGTARPDYKRCVEISTKVSIHIPSHLPNLLPTHPSSVSYTPMAMSIDLYAFQRNRHPCPASLPLSTSINHS